MNELILRARDFAREAHKAQVRRYTGEPYFVHLEEVAGIVEQARLSADAVAAAWLHDVAEDQGVLISEICSRFSSDVALMVFDLTDTPARDGINGEQRKAADIERLSRASAETQSIKCADLVSNTATIVKYDPGFAKIYLPQKRAILDVLTRAHPGLKYYAEMSLRTAEQELLQAALSAPG